jgi:DNA-binding winged helix-turn-helix (wHTH) protein
MDETHRSGQTLRFGLFEVDLRAGELRKNGVKLKLQEQPFQILTMLLERAGEVITREQLRQQLWPADTFVDFDQGLNKAINKIRQALGDSAEDPRFVETLARRGYRFIAPARRRSAGASASAGSPPKSEGECGRVGDLRGWSRRHLDDPFHAPATASALCARSPHQLSRSGNVPHLLAGRQPSGLCR